MAVILDCAGTAQRRRRFRNPRVSRATKRHTRHKRNALCLFAAIAVWWCFRVLRGSFQSGVALAPWDKKAGADGRLPSRISHGASMPPHSRTQRIRVRPSRRKQSFWTAPAERSDDGAFAIRGSVEPQKGAEGTKEMLCASLRPSQFGGAFVFFAVHSKPAKNQQRPPRDLGAGFPSGMSEFKKT